jgi:rod shape-determining protein MreD
MSEAVAMERWPVWLCLLAALLLSIVPLPALLEAFRPDWVALTLIYWALVFPRVFGLLTAWASGLLLDVAQGTLLGQHALALTVMIYFPLRFHLRLRVFPIWQLSATVMALLALYQFILFWINGTAGVASDLIDYWGSVITGALVWPPLMLFFNGMRQQMTAER